MSTNTSPSPNFTGINFNLDFFPSEAGDFVTYPVSQGPTTIATLYSSVIDTLSSSTSFNLLNSLTANLNIATNGTTGQTIRIGATSGASVHCANVDFQNHSINNSTNASGGNINICNSMTTGTLNLGNNTARSGNVNIGTGAGATGTIDIGSSTTTTTLNGNVRGTTKLTTPIIDCITDAGAGSTSLSIGPSAVNGNIIIGASLGVGDVAIGGSQSSGGTITLGSSNTVTTTNGTLSTNDNYFLSGSSSTAITVSSGKIRVEVNQGSRTITLANYNNEAIFLNTGTGGGGGGFTLPTVASAKGYKFIFRSVQLSATTEITKNASDGNCILTTGAKAYDVASATNLVSMGSGTTRTFISDGTFWVQI
jgi:hypothetical protein